MCAPQWGMAYGVRNTVLHSCAIAVGDCLTTVADRYAHVNNLYIDAPVTAADQAAAVTAGLTAGQVYKTSAGDLKIVY
jgi:hypothetical protein